MGQYSQDTSIFLSPNNSSGEGRPDSTAQVPLKVSFSLETFSFLLKLYLVDFVKKHGYQQSTDTGVISAYTEQATLLGVVT